MSTPVRVFCEIASRYGVDANDNTAVEKFYAEALPKLPSDKRNDILSELLARQGEAPGDAPSPNYGKDIPLPRLEDAEQFDPTKD